MTTEDEAEARRAAFARKHAHESRSLAALDWVRESLKIPQDTEGYGFQWLKTSGVKPLLDVRCSNGHKLGGVWRTEAGGVFVAWPEISSGQEIRSRQFTMTAGASRRRAVVDLVADDDPYAVDARLRASCDCRGLRSLPEGTRALLASAYATALTGRPSRLTVEEPLR